VLLDEMMPDWDATRVEHRVIAGPRTHVYETALDIDFLDVPREVPAVRSLFAVRSAGERLVAAARRVPPTPVEAPPSMRLRDMTSHGEWVDLGRDAGAEIAFGAVGRFWAGRTAWIELDAADFAAFAEPAFARIACNLSFRDYGPQTLVSYEARTRATDAAARAAFLRYWRVVDLFVGVVMRGTLRLLDHAVRDGSVNSSRPHL
jgi:hypothetical protein